ncbi:MAG: AMP-dependent synthetase, partial [Oxalobacteraceae bacterium]
MHPYTRFFPHRISHDQLTTAPLIHAGLLIDDHAVRVTFEGRSLATLELRQRVAALQQVLADRGLRAGHRVAVMLGNSDDQIVLIYALILCGLVWIPINTKLRGPGLDYPFEHARPDLVVGDAEFAERLADSAAAQLTYVGIDALHEQALAYPAATLRLED